MKLLNQRYEILRRIICLLNPSELLSQRGYAGHYRQGQELAALAAGRNRVGGIVVGVMGAEGFVFLTLCGGHVGDVMIGSTPDQGDISRSEFDC